MKIAFISTINSLNEISSLGDIEFCLAPFCKNSFYKRYFQYTHKYVILDNGVAENILISNEELVDLAIEMKVSEIIIPDIIGDYNKTKIMREDFLKKYYSKLKESNIKIQSVVQGKIIDEYEQSLKELNCDYRIDVIGIPFRINYALFNNKTSEENHMLNRLLFLNTFIFFKPVHCLGCNLLLEIKHLSYLNNVRSIDTKLISRYGLNNKIFNFDDKIKPKEKLFIDKDLNNNQIGISIQNINKLREGLKL